MGVTFLIKLQPASLQLYQKKKQINLFPCEVCEIFKNIFFIEPLRTAASVPSASTFGFVKKFFTFFSPKLKLAFIELFWGGCNETDQ